MNRRDFLGSTLGIAGALLLPWKPKAPVQSIVPVAPVPKPVPVQQIPQSALTYVSYETCQTQELYNRSGSLLEIVQYGHVKHPHVLDSLTMTCQKCGRTEMQILSNPKKSL
jgi:hypothetical protein